MARPYVLATRLLWRPSTIPKVTRAFVRHTHNTRSTLPEFSLQGKNCIGIASQGLGHQILAAFARSGAHGAVIDLNLSSARESIKTINSEIQSHGLPPAKLHAYECDASDESGVRKTFTQILDDFDNKIDVLVTNAGITGGAPAEDYPLDDWKQMLDVNINGTFVFAREVGKFWIETKQPGVILMVSSMSGTIVNRPQKQAAYNTSKAATAHMMKSLAAEWGPHGIRVNALSPGYIQTAVNEGKEMEELSKEWVKHISLGRIAKPEEFRGAAVCMCSDASSYLTGSEIVVDGGYVVL